MHFRYRSGSIGRIEAGTKIGTDGVAFFLQDTDGRVCSLQDENRGLAQLPPTWHRDTYTMVLFLAAAVGMGVEKCSGFSGCGNGGVMDFYQFVNNA